MRVHHTIQVRPQGEPSMLGHTVRVQDRQKARERTKKKSRYSLRASQYNAKPAGANF